MSDEPKRKGKRAKARKAEVAAPVDDAPVEKASAPVEDAPVEDAPVEEAAPVEDAPVKEAAPSDRGWGKPKPEHIPRPTFWPAGLALGITFLFWGIVTSPVVAAVGFAVFVVSLSGWIGEMRHEANQT